MLPLNSAAVSANTSGVAFLSDFSLIVLIIVSSTWLIEGILLANDLSNLSK